VRSAVPASGRTTSSTAILVAVSVVGILVALVLFDPSLPREYRLPAASPRRCARPDADEEVRYAA